MKQRNYIFSVHELLMMAALAALGGVTGTALGLAGQSLRAVLGGIPGGLQFLAGIHVLWLVLAAGLVRHSGAATATGLLKGAVELLSGNPHGLVVLLMSGLAGLVVDAVWLVCGRRDRLAVYILAGGAGAASNLVVFKLVFSLPSQPVVGAALAALAMVAFVSGAVLAGLLGWSLLDGLRRAGVAGAQRPTDSGPPGWRTWLGMGMAGALTLLIGFAAFFGNMKRTPQHQPAPPASQIAAPEETER
ncbi:MAG TPA: ECF transporter S component [Phycisphaerae bacterium]|nr:ECF transporter S component [Phycisphaerae bacterium]